METREALDGRPLLFFADFALVNWVRVKNAHSGERRWCSSLPESVEAKHGRRSLKTYKGLSFGSHPSKPKLQYGHLTKSSLSGVGQ